MQVVVTGAGGRTGALVVQKLLEQTDKFEAIATVRNQQASLSPGLSFLPMIS
jgi:uncharacterized protein YbjT (DUF2867 family)